MRTLCAVLLLAALAVAADAPAAKKPKPLTPEQKSAVLILANATGNARQAVLMLELQYKSLREKNNADLQKAEAAEVEAVGKLKKELGVPDACKLTDKAEWDCEEPPRPGTHTSTTK